MSDVFSKTINELIRASLVDGAISDKEREVVRNQAIKEGVDPDMVDIMLDAELQKLNQANRARRRLCPHCGAELEEFNTRCPACGEEIRNSRAANSVKMFSDRLQEIASSNRSTKEKRKEAVAYIEGFNVPRKREDLLEFLSLAAANASTEGGISGTWKKRFWSVIGLSIVFWMVFSYAATKNVGHGFFLDLFVVLAVAVMFTSFTGLPIAFWYARKGGNDTLNEHNYMAPHWKKKFQSVMGQARGILTQPGDMATLDALEQQVGK